MRIKNMEVSSRHKILKSFYENYLGSFDISVENSDKFLTEKVQNLKTKQMDKDYQLNHFDKALVKIHDAQSKKKHAIAEYKGKFLKIVLDSYDNDLYKHAIIQEWLDTIKNIDKTKLNLNRATHALNSTINHFMTTYEQSQYLEGKSRVAEKCTHQYSLEFKNALESFGNYIKKYCEQLVSIIPKSKSKETQTMVAIKNSFTHFLDITKDTFGPESVKEFSSSYNDFETLSRSEVTYTTFEVDSMLTPKNHDVALELLGKTQISEVNEFLSHTNTFVDGIDVGNICEAFVRMQADVNITEVRTFKN